MRRWVLIGGGLLLLVAVIVELAALPVATRTIGDALERCTSYEDLEVESVARPVLPRLLVGRARDVELEVTGLRYEELRVDRARLELPEVALPWSPLRPPQAEATLQLTVSEADLQDHLTRQAPFGLEPVVELSPGVLVLGVLPVPARVQLEPEVLDGALRLAPAGPSPGWFDALGLGLTFDIPEGVEVERLEIGQDALFAVLQVEDALPGIDGSPDCSEAFGTDARRREG